MGGHFPSGRQMKETETDRETLIISLDERNLMWRVRIKLEDHTSGGVNSHDVSPAKESVMPVMAGESWAGD